LSPTKLKVILAFALTFVALTLFEVVTQREDWPLSSYPMYGKLTQKTITRTQLVGVSEQGEFPLSDAQTSPYNGSRLLVLSRQLAKRPAQAREFARVLGSRYERKRAQRRWPLLQAVRSYAETWVVKPGLAGINNPARTLENTLYVPPPALVERLKAETSNKSAAPSAVPLPRGDLLVDLDAAACDEGCSAEADPQAAGGSALSLSGGAEPGRLTTRVRLERGTYRLFVRMKVRSVVTTDRLFLELDGKRVGAKTGLGNYLDTLPYVAWLWTSQRPGFAPLKLDIESEGEHVLTLSTSSKLLLVDQLWLSRRLRELPVDNAPRLP
jgi:hypothetical protein